MEEEFWEIEYDVDSFYEYTLPAIAHKFHVSNYNPESDEIGRSHQILRDCDLLSEIIELYCRDFRRRTENCIRKKIIQEIAEKQNEKA